MGVGHSHWYSIAVLQSISNHPGPPLIKIQSSLPENGLPILSTNKYLSYPSGYSSNYPSNSKTKVLYYTSNLAVYRCVYQEEDSERFKGLRVSKDLIEIGGDALKTNITTLGPLVLPFSEQLLFFATLVWRNLFGHGGPQQPPTKPYIPDYKLAFEHFCVHAASKTVLDELQRNLGLSDSNVEASRMTLHRFGNTSSSSIWYELAYLEAKERVKRGDRVWQISFGSGFKCNSLVWRAMRRVKKPSSNPWLDCLDRYPVYH